MAKGSIILIIFPFTDLTGTKLRPSVVLADTVQDVTVAFITTQLQWQDSNDLFLMPTLYNGSKKPSLVRISKLATLDRMLIRGQIGSLSAADIVNIDEKLKLTFQLT